MKIRNVSKLFFDIRVYFEISVLEISRVVYIYIELIAHSGEGQKMKRPQTLTFSLVHHQARTHGGEKSNAEESGH